MSADERSCASCVSLEAIARTASKIFWKSRMREGASPNSARSSSMRSSCSLRSLTLFCSVSIEVVTTPMKSDIITSAARRMKVMK